MAQSRIEKLKAMIKTEKEKKEKNGNGGGFRNDIYPFWLMKVGETARVRILADSDEDNENMFFASKLEHTLAVNGDDHKVPCLHMYGEDCPICDVSRKYYKDEGKGSKNGKRYYRKKTSLVRVLVLDDPLPADPETGEKYTGKVCSTQFGFQLMEKINAEILGDAFEDGEDFTDLDAGYDFIIGKTKQGEESTYAFASGFARRPSSVPMEYREGITPMALSSRFPKNPGYDKVMAMLSADMYGTEYVEEDGGDSEGKTEDAPKTPAREVTPPKNSTPKNTPAKTVAETVEDEEEEEDEDSVSTDEDGEEDIIAVIARRKAQQNRK